MCGRKNLSANSLINNLLSETEKHHSSGSPFASSGFVDLIISTKPPGK